MAVSAMSIPMDSEILNYRETASELKVSIKPVGPEKTNISLKRSAVDSAGKLIDEVVKETTIIYERTFFFLGEEFLISEEDNSYLIFHRMWPLSGQGDTIQEAQKDLINTLYDLKHHYWTTPINKLDDQAIVFRDFILNRLKF